MVCYRMSPDTPLLQLIASVAAGVFLWAIGLLLSKHRLAAEVLRFVQKGSKQHPEWEEKHTEMQLAAAHSYGVAGTDYDGPAPDR